MKVVDSLITKNKIIENEELPILYITNIFHHNNTVSLQTDFINKSIINRNISNILHKSRDYDSVVFDLNLYDEDTMRRKYPSICDYFITSVSKLKQNLLEMPTSVDEILGGY